MEPALPQQLHRQIHYKPLGKTEIPQVIPIVAQTFIQHEPVSLMGLNLSDMEDMVKSVIFHPGVEALCTVAVHDPTGVVVGACLAEDFANPSPPPTAKVFAPIVKLLQGMEEHYPASNPITPNRHLHIYMLGVDDAFMNHGIGGYLIDHCLYQAARFGFQKAFAEAVAMPAQHLLEKRGFQTLYEIPFAKFEYLGNKVFGSIKNPASAKLMMKDIPRRADAFPAGK